MSKEKAIGNDCFLFAQKNQNKEGDIFNKNIRVGKYNLKNALFRGKIVSAEIKSEVWLCCFT